jgi:hypothetical protein
MLPIPSPRCPSPSGITSAVVQGRSALGPRAGARVLQLGRVTGAPLVTTTGSRQAHLDGFDLHANVAVAANNRDGLEPARAQRVAAADRSGAADPLPRRPGAPDLESGMERRHHAPVVRTDRAIGTPGGSHAAPTHQPRPASRCAGTAQPVARPGGRLRAGHTRLRRSRRSGPMRHGRSTPSRRAHYRLPAGRRRAARRTAIPS